MSKRLSVDELIKGRHFGAEIIVLCVRWYLGCKLSYRDLAGIMAERGSPSRRALFCAGSSTMHYAPEFEKRWNRFARPGWRRLVARDETCVKIGGRWPPDGRTSIAPWMPGGKTVDFRLSPKRDAAAAKAFFRKAFKTHGRVPRTMRLITLLALAIGNLRFANHPTVV